MRRQRLALYELPDYIPRKNRHNDYGFDPHEQASSTYTGLGDDINVHDQWAVESMGAIQDRTREHLGASDKAIAACRRLLLRGIRDVAEGRAAPMAAPAEPPACIDAIGPIDGWERFWRDQAQHRRESAPWSQTAPAAA
jgi:hypothetical protein